MSRRPPAQARAEAERIARSLDSVLTTAIARDDELGRAVADILKDRSRIDLSLARMDVAHGGKYDFYEGKAYYIPLGMASSAFFSSNLRTYGTSPAGPDLTDLTREVGSRGDFDCRIEGAPFHASVETTHDPAFFVVALIDR